ncbi:hypothetical protein N7540_011865 [Penicillium herquei]|nr:hypothetical protein N7540_011865 [Penicillium herquei]
MPLVISAINLKLSKTTAEIHSRQTSLKCLAELMSHSRRVYDVSDFISTQTDKILHLAYLTSQQIFLQEDGRLLSQPHSAQTPQPCNEVNTQLGERRIKTWHDAFLNHTRAYLLIITTVDYFMSVGRLPEEKYLPELVCFMPPLDRIKLPWTLQPPRITEESSESPEVSKEGERGSSLPKTLSNATNQETYSLDILPIGFEACTELDWTEELEQGASNHHSQTIEPNVVNVDYFDLESPMSQTLPIGSQASIQSRPSPQQNSAISRMFGRQPIFQEWSQLSSAYDTYISILIQEFFGPADTLHVEEEREPGGLRCL